MDAEIKHIPVLTARQIQKSLQSRLAARLATLKTDLFNDFADVALDAPNTADAYWSCPLDMDPPGEIYNTPSIGIQWQESQLVETGGDVKGMWESRTPYRIVIAIDAPSARLSLEVSQAYASAVVQVMGNFRADAIASVASGSSLGQSIPITTVKPDGTAAARPAWWDEGSETLLITEIVVNVSQYEKAL